MKRLILPVAVSLCLVLAVSKHTVIAKDSWIGVRTKNFYLIGNGGENEVRKVGLKLEQFREVFTRLFPNMKFNTPVPTTVVVFKSDDSYAPFKPRPNTGGYFQPGEDVNYITLTTEVPGRFLLLVGGAEPIEEAPPVAYLLAFLRSNAFLASSGARSGLI